jgi:hypothetical protein
LIKISKLEFILKAIDLAYKLKSQEQIAKVFLTQGVYYRDNFNFFEAIKKFKQGVTYLQKSKDSKQLSKLNYYLADSYSLFTLMILLLNII